MNKTMADSSHEGNGRPGYGVLSPGVEKLMNAVAHLMDVCEDQGAATNGALALVTRRENELMAIAAKYDARLAALRDENIRLKAGLAQPDGVLPPPDDGAGDSPGAANVLPSDRRSEP